MDCPSSYQVAIGWLQAVANLSLHESFYQEASKLKHAMAGFRLQQSTTQLTPLGHTQRVVSTGIEAFWGFSNSVESGPTQQHICFGCG